MKKSLFQKLRLPLLILLIAFGFFAYFSASMQRIIATQMMNLEEFRLGFSDAYINVDGLNYHYLDNNNTEATQIIVMIHGFGADTSNWPRFAKLFVDDYRIIVPDLIGFGESDKPMSLSYDYESQAARVHQFISQLGIQQYHVVGNSMGGAISAVLAYKHPQAITSAALFNSAGIVYTHTEVTRSKAGHQLIAETREEFDKTIAIVMEKPPFIPWPIKNIKADEAINDAALKKHIFSHIKTKGLHDLTTILPQIQQQTLVLWGDKDRVLHPDNAHDFHKLLPNSTLHIMKEIGHLPMVETPKGSAKIYAEFLNNL